MAGNWLGIHIFIYLVTAQVRIHLSRSLKEQEERKNKEGDQGRQNILSALPGEQEKIDCMAVGSQYNITLQNRIQPQEQRGVYASCEDSLWLSFWEELTHWLPFVLHQPSHHRRTDSTGGKFAKNIDIIHGCFLYLPHEDRRSALSAHYSRGGCSMHSHTQWLIIVPTV